MSSRATKKPRGRPRKNPHPDNPNGPLESGEFIPGPDDDRHYECLTCLKKFKKRDALRVHMVLHDAVKPFACKYEGCSNSYATLYSLKIHIMSHTGERPFVCDLGECRQGFKTLQNLQLHQRNHARKELAAAAKQSILHIGKSFLGTVCLYCNVDFTSFKNLNGHLREDSGCRRVLLLEESKKDRGKTNDETVVSYSAVDQLRSDGMNLKDMKASKIEFREYNQSSGTYQEDQIPRLHSQWQADFSRETVKEEMPERPLGIVIDQ
ncbi:hypothetical protein BDR26DRAFT_869681 [Obelidium mucronatum]|nr:hypothetical protein BDR26DRAFT_869681 [Obelidium mucronatum]